MTGGPTTDMAVLACPARNVNVAEQILQLGFIKKHIHNFLADIVSRESHKIGEGTMVLKAAAVNMLADAEVRTGRRRTTHYSSSQLLHGISRMRDGQDRVVCSLSLYPPPPLPLSFPS